MIRKTLFGKLLLLFLGFGALMVAALVYVMGVSHERYHAESDQLANRNLARQYVAANLLIREPPLTAHNYANALRHLIEINPDVDVYVLDASGNILASSVEAPARKRIELNPIRQFITEAPQFPLLGDDPSTPGRREIFSAAPLSIAGCPAAYLYIVLHREEHAAAAAGLKTLYAVRDGIGVVTVAIVLALAGSLLLLRMLTRRLGDLKQDIERFRDNEYSAPFAAPEESGSGDEIERLRHLFVQLAEKIRGQMGELQKVDELRRELLTNVSHDLRTPLTILYAHLETLLLRDEPSKEELRNSLGTAFAQCRRLAQLIEQLLELAKLDAGQATFNPEPFQIADLAHEVVSKFALTARRAEAEVRVEHAESLPLVVGDVRLIEQVVEHLLDNALRHVTQGGHVHVRLTRHQSSVRVDVHDTGPGIPANERSRIFERFYRGDKSRSTESGYFGLGLAIVRGILGLHGTSIDFVSGPKCGTTFFFELPIAPMSGLASTATPFGSVHGMEQRDSINRRG